MFLLFNNLDSDRWPWLETIKNKIIQETKLIIACSSLRKSYREFLKNDRSTQKFKIFFLNVPKSEIGVRLRNRTQHFATADLLDSQFKTLEFPDSSEQDYVEIIDANKTIDKVIQTIIQKLV